MGEKVITFETNDTIPNYSSELGFNDFIFPYASVRTVFTLCYIEKIFLFKNKRK